MPNVKVVIGANYGDEGKGLMTDYFCSQADSRKETCIVTLSNGGAQRGHTVVTPDGIRHVFHHFGSGTFVGAATYLCSYFIINPMTFRQEYEELEAMGYAPVVYAHRSCKWSTPYDMMTNQILEESRGKDRHGSCGMGIWETEVRYNYQRAQDLHVFNQASEKDKINSIVKIREVYGANRLDFLNLSIPTEWKSLFASHGMIEHFIEDVDFVCKHVTWVSDDRFLLLFQNIIFENGQGLMLDARHTIYTNNTTPSNTGIENPFKIITSLSIPHTRVEVCYVTRTYLTRHGAGLLDGECDKILINPDLHDKTNIFNQFQGHIRYGLLDVNKMMKRIQNDIFGAPYKISIAVTHINEYDIPDGLRATYLSDGETRDSIYKIQ